MAEDTPSTDGSHLVRIEPGHRLVVLARTLQAHSPGAEAALKDGVLDWPRFGPTCLGQALYGHRSIFRNAVDAPVWSHLELSYFRDLVPAEIIHDLVTRPQPVDTDLLRAEILLTTPASFVLPRGWQGSADHPRWQVSLEYIQVQPAFLGAYRDIMRTYIGPAAARLVEAGKIGTFRTLETAAILHHAPALTADWNQIHLCEVEADTFNGFGATFDAVLREMMPDGGFTGVFAGLDRMRTIPRWTFNAPVAEADGAVGRAGDARF